MSGFGSLFGAPGSPRAWRLFELGFRPWLALNLSAIELRGTPTVLQAPFLGAERKSQTPLILVANHTSWYDGFLLREVHRTLRPDAPLRSLMLKRELDQAPVLRWIGGTGFDPERPVTLRGALNEVEALRSEGVVVSFFPQGRIFPATRRPLGFRRGIDLVLRSLAPCHVLPVGLHLEMSNRVRPTAWVTMGTPISVDTPPITSLQARLEANVQGLLDAVQRHLDTHGEDSAEAPFSP